MESQNRKSELTFFTGLDIHLLALGALLMFLFGLRALHGPWEGIFLGLSSEFWFWLSIAIPIFHQFYIFLCWRIELFHDKAITRQLGFTLYRNIFLVLLLLRPALLTALGYANKDTLGLPFWPRLFLSSALLAPALYALYSTVRYFKIDRASGGDHFLAQYRQAPMVNQGIFKYTSNGMYGYLFLLFWSVAIALNSTAALISAGFCHAYIWVHFFATEKPDMEYIFKSTT